MLFGLDTTTRSAAAEAARGVDDRLRSLPISAFAIVLGRCVADTLNSLAVLLLLAGFGLAIGWRPDTSPGEVVGVLGALLLSRFALLWVGLSVGDGPRRWSRWPTSRSWCGRWR